MAGTPNQAKRAIVRRYLMSEEGRTASDNEAAKQCLVSRILVVTVRRQLIAQGLLPGVREIPAGRSGKGVIEFQYKPGSSARGGYVFDERGRAIQKGEWEKKQRAKKRKAKKK